MEFAFEIPPFEVKNDSQDKTYPRNMKEARSRSDWNNWWMASLAEFKSLLHNNTWEEVTINKEEKTIGTRWVYIIKHDEYGKPSKYKARLVAQGFTQKCGINYDSDEIYTPVASLTSLRLLIAMGTMMGAEIHHLDVDSAYLNGKINRDIYLRIPEGYDELIESCSIKHIEFDGKVDS